MVSLIFLLALCFGTTVESLQTIIHSGHLDVMHQPAYICILAGIDFLVWCLVFRAIGGYTFHQRTAIESDWLKKNPHLPCLRRRSYEDALGKNQDAMPLRHVENENSTKQNLPKNRKEDANIRQITTNILFGHSARWG